MNQIVELGEFLRSCRARMAPTEAGMPVSTRRRVLGRRTDVVATNSLARALIADFDAMPAHEHNQARFLFLDPAACELYEDWDAAASDTAQKLHKHGAGLGWPHERQHSPGGIPQSPA